MVWRIGSAYTLGDGHRGILISRLALSRLPLVRYCAHRQKLVHMVLDIIQFVQSDLADAVRVLSPIVRAYGLPIVFIGIFVESAGMVLAPGETLLIAAGFLASKGTLNPIAVLIVSLVASIHPVLRENPGHAHHPVPGGRRCCSRRSFYWQA